MALLLTGGRRGSVVFSSSSTRPSAGTLFANRSTSSLVFGRTLVVIEVGIPAPIAPIPKFTVPPDFVFPAAIVGTDIAGGLWPESSTLPQRVVKCLLDGGTLYYGAKPAGIRRALPFLEAGEYATFAERLAANPPAIVHNFPRQGAQLPTLAILAGSERISFQESFLNDFATVGVDQYGDASFQPIDLFSAGFDSELSVYVYAENAEETIFWYEVAKYVLQQARFLLTKVGIDNLKLSGKELHPDPVFLPEFLYVRELTLSFRTRQVFAQEAPLIAHVEAFVQTKSQTD